MAYHRDIPLDRCELNPSNNECWCSNVFVISLISAHVADGRIGENKCIDDKEEAVAGLTAVSWDENSEKTK